MDNIMNILNVENLLLSGGVILGILISLFGLKFHKLVLAIVGFVVGFALGNIVVDITGVDNQSLALVIRFGLALVIGGFSFTLFESLISILVGVGIFVLISDMIGAVWYSYLIGIIVGLIGAGLVNKFYKLGVVLFTSLAGSYLVSNGVVGYFEYSYMMVFGIVFIISFIFQFMTNKIKI